MPKTAAAKHETKTDEAVPEDFRVRAAREKRERMRRRLLDATLQVCSLETIRNPAMIDDVLAEADVSRGTFYNYFTSLDEAIDELGHELLHDMVATVASVLPELRDPAQKVVVGPLMYLARAAQDPRWGIFVLRFDHLGDRGEDNVLRAAVARDLSAAQSAGAIDYPVLEAAMDMLVGSCRQAVLRIVEGEGMDLEYIHGLVTMLMLALGMDRHQALEAVRRTWAYLLVHHGEDKPWIVLLERTRSAR